MQPAEHPAGPQEALHPSLAACPPAALEEYVRQRMLQLLQHPALELRLGAPAAAAMRQAALEVMGADSQAVAPPAAGGPATELALVFKHDCRQPGCADMHCLLCAQSQHRRCSRTFAPKYLAGDAIKAACGAAIRQDEGDGRVELCDRLTGRPLAQHPQLQLELSIVDGRAYQALAAERGGQQVAEDELARVTLLLNQQGQPLLSSKHGSTDIYGHLVLALARGSAPLLELTVTGSSEALLSGQRPPFALAVAVVDAESGKRREDIPVAVSDSFVVATPRVKSATKSAIPRLSDHVSKLACVGNATQAKLRDLARAAVEAGLQDSLQLPMASATTVGEFKALVEWAEQEAARCEAVKKMLKLSRSWDEAREHAMKAVGDDRRLRAFFPDDSLAQGLLFPCSEATPGLDSPLALLGQACDAAGQPTLQARLLHPDQPPLEPDPRSDGNAPQSGGSQAERARLVHSLLQQAKACWARRGHPGWALLPLDTAAFQQGWGHLSEALLPASVTAALVLPTPHGGASLAPAAEPAAAAWQLAGSMAADMPPQPAARGLAGLLARPAAAAPASVAGGTHLGGSVLADPGSGGTGTSQQGEIVREFAALGVQSPRLPGSLAPSPPPHHGLGSSPFDVGGDAPVTPGTHLPPPDVAQQLGANLTSRVLYSPSVQPHQRMVPVAQSGGGGGGGALPLHVQLAGAGGPSPSLQPRSSDESAAEAGGFVSNEPSLTPPQPAAAAARPLPASPQATPDLTPAGDCARLAGDAGAGPDLGSQQLASLLSLPPMQLFSPGGPLSLAAIAELDAAAEAAEAGAGGQLGATAGKTVSPVQSLADMLAGQEGGTGGASLDWEQLLREAYRLDGGGSSGACLPPARQGSVEAEVLLRMLSHTSGASAELARLGTLPGLEGLFAEGSNLDQLLLPTTDPLPAPGDATASGGLAAASPARKRALRMLTPEWTKLLSLSPAEWAALTQPPAPAPAPPSMAGPNGNGESNARPPSQAGADDQSRQQGTDAGAAREERGGRKRELSPGR